MAWAPSADVGKAAFKDAIELSKAGRCRAALGRFGLASQDFGRSHHGTPGRGEAEIWLGYAHQAIVNNCIIPERAGVYGTRRRPRRRRRR